MRLRRPVVIGAIAVLVLLTIGGGVAAAMTMDPQGTTPTSTGATHVRGTVTAENGPSWTVTTSNKRTVTVALTPQTSFGKKTAAQFPVGSQVRVSGTKQGDTVTAERIAAPAAGA
jgi:hypothetical protein